MRRYGLYDATRGLMTALAAGLAGLLLWVATQVGSAVDGPLLGGDGHRRGRRASCSRCCRCSAAGRAGCGCGSRRGRSLLGVLPALVVVGWILLATQPGNGWHEGRFVSWSHDLGLMGIVHALGLWHGVLAFGFGRRARDVARRGAGAERRSTASSDGRRGAATAAPPTSR